MHKCNQNLTKTQKKYKQKKTCNQLRIHRKKKKMYKKLKEKLNKIENRAKRHENKDSKNLYFYFHENFHFAAIPDTSQVGKYISLI